MPMNQSSSGGRSTVASPSLGLTHCRALGLPHGPRAPGDQADLLRVLPLTGVRLGGRPRGAALPVWVLSLTCVPGHLVLHVAWLGS